MRRLILAALVLATIACRPAPESATEPVSEPARQPKKPQAPVPAFRAVPPLSEIDPAVPFKAAPLKPELELTDAQRRAVVSSLRAACDGEPVDAPELKDVVAPLIAVNYSEGGKRRRRVRLEEAPLPANLRRAGEQLCRKGADRDGFLHALVVTYTARLPNFGIKGVYDNKVFEPQVTGLAWEIGERRVELDPLQQLEGNMGRKMVRAALAKKMGIDASKMPSRNDLTVEIYRTDHLAERYPDRSYGRFLRGHARLDADELTHDLLDERIKLIGEWYRNNVRNGEVVYEYSPHNGGEYREHDRTMVRSTMAVWILNRLAFFLDDDDLKKKGAETIGHYFENYFRMDESKAAGKLLPSPRPLQNGNTVMRRWSVASFIAAACNERLDKEKYTQEMDLLMEWAMAHLRKDGVYWVTYGQGQYFFPGQLLLAVSYFYRDTKDEKYKEHFDKAFAVYAPVLEQMMHLGPGWHAPYAPAWFTQPSAQMYLVTGEDKYKDLVFAINDRVVQHYDINARYQVYPDYDGMLAPKPNSYGNNSITAASLESLVDATLVAKRAGDTERYARYQRVVRRAVAFLLRLQWTPENTYYLPHRERMLGGFKRDMLNTVSWMDSVWHLTSAFMKVQQNRLLEPMAAPSE
jgi:hypothetical protein